MRDEQSRVAVMRVDGGDVIGYGHIMRSCGIAEALGDVGFQPVFYTRPVDGSGIETLRKEGWEPVVIPSDLPEEKEPEWVLEHVKSNTGTPLLVVVDSYHIPEFHWVLYQEDAVVLATDVFGNRDYRGVDLIYNGYAHAPNLEYSLCSRDTELLLGLEWAVLRKEVLRNKPLSHPPQPKQLKRVLVNGGGVDEHDVAGRVASMFTMLPPDKAPEEALFVTGTKYPFRKRLDYHLAKIPFAKRLIQPDNWLELIASSDLLLISGGMVQYEGAFFGTPYIVLLVEENQRDSALAMQKLGITRVAGWLNELSDWEILEVYLDISRDLGTREVFSVRGRNILDGFGAKRVARACLIKVNKRINT